MKQFFCFDFSLHNWHFTSRDPFFSPLFRGFPIKYDLLSKCSLFQTYTHIHVCVVINGSSCCSPSVSPNTRSALSLSVFCVRVCVCVYFHLLSNICFVFSLTVGFYSFVHILFISLYNQNICRFIHKFDFMIFLLLCKIENVCNGSVPLSNIRFNGTFSSHVFGFCEWYFLISIRLVFGLLFNQSSNQQIRNFRLMICSIGWCTICMCVVLNINESWIFCVLRSEIIYHFFFVPKQASRRVDDLFEDLRDGHNLLSLLEVLSGEHLVSIQCIQVPFMQQNKQRFYRLIRLSFIFLLFISFLRFCSHEKREKCVFTCSRMLKWRSIFCDTRKLN